ncbi:XylR N-terminal domain-containing protein [Bacillus sp. 1NLA3E]|uniref:XylR N-terminal domain-containing protein n=1 Tax=Bacillus sp. 1NLA3E TaxID=666686 RepID=UPI000247EC67|nr:XylR N-terminal domain-containing protein [Bacillus sp. 1NLA3E]
MLVKKTNIIQSNNGKLMLNNQRIVVTPSSGIGTLRKNLIETIGYERTKTFLIRYGWNLGVSDATVLMQEMEGASLNEIIMEGPKQHMLMGHAIIEGIIIKLDSKNNHFHMEGTWLNSYEAQEHIRLFGISNESVCHILVGYASGYTSKVLGTTVIFKEKTCEGKGAEFCLWVGKTLEDWNGEIDQELGFFKENNLINELENAYEQIVVERDNLNQTFVFHKNLMEQIMLGKDLQSIAEMVHEFLGVPILIANQNKRTLASIGLTAKDIENYYGELTKWFKNNNKEDVEKKLRNKRDLDKPHILTKLISVAEDQHYLVSPIIVRQKLVGYCTLILKCKEIKDINRMILERTASASSIYLLSQQIAIETEQRSRGYFLEQIISKQLTKEEILKWGNYVGIDLEDSFYVAVLNKISKNKRMIKKDQLEFNEQLIGNLSTYFTKKKARFLIGQRLDNIVILIQEKFIKEQGTEVPVFFEEILEYCQTMYRAKNFKIGISLCSNSIETTDQQYEEALAAFQMASLQRRIISYDGLGAVGILIQAGNESVIKRFTENQLGKLINYDKKKGTEFIRTLYVYLSHGGNLEITASTMALSISGLRYRLQKIENLLNVDIRNPHINYQLYLAIQLLIVNGELNLDL